MEWIRRFGGKKISSQEALEHYQKVRLETQQFLSTDPARLHIHCSNKRAGINRHTQTEPAPTVVNKEIQTTSVKSVAVSIQTVGGSEGVGVGRTGPFLKLEVKKEPHPFSFDSYDDEDLDSSRELFDDEREDTLSLSSSTATALSSNDYIDECKPFQTNLRKKLGELREFKVEVGSKDKPQGQGTSSLNTLVLVDDVLHQKRLHEMRKTNVQVKVEQKAEGREVQASAVKAGESKENSFVEILNKLKGQEEVATGANGGKRFASKKESKVEMIVEKKPWGKVKMEKLTRGQKSKVEQERQLADTEFKPTSLSKAASKVKAPKLDLDSKMIASQSVKGRRKSKVGSNVSTISSVCKDGEASLRTRASQKRRQEVKLESSKVEIVRMDTRSRSKANESKSEIMCETCGKYFANASALRQHSAFHRPERPFKCEAAECGKAYKTRSEFNRHQVSHKEKKEFQCHVCQKLFLRKPYLKTHLNRHPEVTLFSCAQPMCTKMYITKTELDCHTLTYHRRNASRRSSRIIALALL